MTKTGLAVGSSNTSPQSAFQINGAMFTGVPTQSGLHAGMVTATTPAIVLNGTASTAIPYISWTYVGSTYAGTIFYNCATKVFTVNTGSGVQLTLTDVGLFGIGVATPLAPLHAASNFVATSTAYTKGVLGGMETGGVNARLCICASSNTAASNLDFSYAGQVTGGSVGGTTASACQARIALFHTAGLLAFYTKQYNASTNNVPCMTLDGSTANQTVLINSSTSASTSPHRLYVTGSAAIVGTLTATNPKTPKPQETWKYS